jgi:hypothetical protein
MIADFVAPSSQDGNDALWIDLKPVAILPARPSLVPFFGTSWIQSCFATKAESILSKGASMTILSLREMIARPF